MADTQASDVPAPAATAPAAAKANASKPTDTRQARPPVKNAASTAATLDERLAREALASMKSARNAARTEIVSPKPRMPVPSTTIVVKPAPSQAWKGPFVTLAMLVCICTIVCAGALAYLLMRPAPISTAANAELRHLRDAVAQLQRNVSALSNDIASTSSALDAASKAASDRYGRVAQNLDRVERAQSATANQIERLSVERTRATQTQQAALAPAPDVTGSIKPPQQPQTAGARRGNAIPGWSVRRAYEGVAILEGAPGVVEVVLGQDVPDLGRIQDIRFDSGRWTVWTSKGVIRSR